MSEVLLRLLAVAGTACGIGVLQAAWRLKARSWPLIGTGWSLIIGSLMAWTHTSGADKGVALGLVAGVIIALLFLASAALKTPPRPSRAARERRVIVEALGARRVSRRIWVGLLVGPLAGLAALAFATAAFVGMRAIEAEHTMNLTLASFAFPMVWAALAVAAVYQVRLWRKTITVFGTGLLSLLVLWVAV